MVENIGYNEVNHEIVDEDWEKEKEVINSIKNSLWNENLLAENTLENLNNDQLSQFLSKECFPEWQTKTYSQISTLPYINFLWELHFKWFEIRKLEYLL